jgi:hypothetical protein
MSGELLFLIYYCGLMVALGVWAQWILKREFKKMSDTPKAKREGVS